MWAQADIESLLDYVEDNQSKAGDHMALQEGHFNGLLPLLPYQANGHHKMAKNCYDKWETSTIAGGLGLAYSADKGANIITKAGQLIMDKLVETHPEAAQFQTKGFNPPDQSETVQIAQDMQPAPFLSLPMPISFPPCLSQYHHQILSSHGIKHKTNATAGLDTASTVTSSALMLTAIGTDMVEQLDEVLSLVYNLEKNLSEENLFCLQMLLKEKPSFIVGYKNAAAKSTMYRM
ncbi:hypothetical protein F5141DRAFT_1061645 [Pisolithus sp. B1]|nr:hypothetical protein F5141DRAFT_1061645 [Pisolithus sp. B1]